MLPGTEVTFTVDVEKVLVTVVGVIVWFTRLEGVAKNNEKRTDALEKRMDDASVKHQALESKLSDELTLIKTMLARIEGKLELKE